MRIQSLFLGALCFACTPDKPAPKPNDKAKQAKKDPKKVKVDLSKGNPKIKPGEAEKFVKELDAELRRLWTLSGEADWAKNTNIKPETEAAAAKATEAVMAFTSKAIKDARKFKGYKGDAAVERQLQLLRLSPTLPAPDDEAKRAELAKISSKMDGVYGKGKHCTEPSNEKTCRDLGKLSEILATEASAKKGSYDKQLEAWEAWRTISVPMKEDYIRFVELGNEGAKDIGFENMGLLWRSGYDMTPQAFEQEADRLWAQVKPLYDSLHCHVRAKLSERYGADKVAADGLLPAHLTGNMWAQEWTSLYGMLEPHPGEASIDVTSALKKAKYDEKQMVKRGESFFTSLGLNPLPDTFWERSMFTKPKDREVVCHASAWDVGMNNDLRIKMCIKVDHEDLVTIHHELGHNYYYNNYYELPVLFQSGAHDGFHEAIGDAIALSITPAYLKEVELLKEVSATDKGVVNKQMQDALSKIAFLPFGKLVDQWRWDVFAGKVKPDGYNAHWWKLRKEMQGVAPASERGEEHFDPGAKFHIPGNTPYARYFLAHIVQFQFHKALCEAAGHEGPLHTCSIYGSKEAGAKLKAMLALGASKPWPVAMEALTGQKEMDGSALIEYFGPLKTYLDEQNKDRKCGW